MRNYGYLILNSARFRPVMYFVPSITLKGLDSLIEHHGAKPNELMLEAGFLPELLQRPDNLIEGQQFSDLIEYCARALNQRFFGLQLAKIQGSTILGPLWFLLRNSATLGEGIHNLIANYPSHTEASYFTTQETPQGTILSYDVNPHLTGNFTQVIELGLGISCLHYQQYIGADWRPKAVYLRTHEPYEKRPMTEVFGNNILFNQDFNGILFTPEELELHHKSASRLQQHYYQHEVNRHQDFNPQSAVIQTENIINGALTRFSCSLDFVASCLHQKPRTLQHYLKQQGTSYQEIYQRVRLRQALRYLSQSSLSVTEISERLQFAETAVFTRFVKKHTGKTPRQYREIQT